MAEVSLGGWVSIRSSYVWGSYAYVTDGTRLSPCCQPHNVNFDSLAMMGRP